MAVMQVRPADAGPSLIVDVDDDDAVRSSPETAGAASAPTITTRSVHWLAEHRTTLALHVTAVLVTVFAIRVVGSGFSEGYPPFFPDSFSFAEVARRGPFTGRFWFDERPVGFPLLYWALGRSVRFVVLAQLALHIAGFGAVVALAVRTLRSVVAQLVVVVFTVALAVQPRFSLWTTHVLSESLAISTGVAAIAAWWWFATTPTRRRAIVAIVVTLGFVLVRDSTPSSSPSPCSRRSPSPRGSGAPNGPPSPGRCSPVSSPGSSCAATSRCRRTSPTATSTRSSTTSVSVSWSIRA